MTCSRHQVDRVVAFGSFADAVGCFRRIGTATGIAAVSFSEVEGKRCLASSFGPRLIRLSAQVVSWCSSTSVGPPVRCLRAVF